MDTSYERKPVAQVAVPTGVEELDVPDVGAHYWIITRDGASIGAIRRDAQTCAARTGQTQRLHFHASSTSCADEVHEDVRP